MSKIDLRIISKPHANLHSMVKTSVKYQKNLNIYLRNKETQQTLWVTKNMLCNASMWYNWAYYMKAISKRQIATG